MRVKTCLLILIFLGLLVYFNSLFNSFLGDDYDQIIRSAAVHHIANIPKFFLGSTYESGGTDKLIGIYYRPIMLTFFSLIYSFFKEQPLYFHLFQVAVHIANAILVYIFLRQFLKNGLAFFASLIFLVHPINNETVVYVANLQDGLFFFFGMLALVVVQQKKLSVKKYFFISLFLLLSFFSKESGILFAIIFLIYILIFNRKFLKPVYFSLPFVIAVYLIFRFIIAKMQFTQTSIAPITESSLRDRLINIPKIFFYYLKTFFYPLDLATNQFWIVKSINFSNFYFPLMLDILFILLILGSSLWIYKFKKAKFKTFIFFSSWLLIGVLLHLQIIPLDMTVSDHWFYFPIVGILGIFGIIIDTLLKNKLVKFLSFAIAVIIILSLAVRTFVRNFDWKDGLTLYAHDVKITPNFYLENALGSELILNGFFKEAKPYIQSSIDSRPYYANLSNMAIIYVTENNRKKAKEYLAKAVNASRNYLIYENYGNFLLVYDHNPNQAKIFSEKALKIFPKNPKLWLVLAQSEYMLGNKSKAVWAAENAYRFGKDEKAKLMYNNLKQNFPIVIEQR